MALRGVRFLPAKGIAGGTLPWVIGVMVYLSALAGGFGFAMNNAVGAWAAGLSNSISVQIVTPEAEARERQAEAAIEVLGEVPGVRAVERVGTGETQALLEPWLGAGNVSEELPIPVLLEVTLAPGRSVDTDALAARVQRAAPDAAFDDHGRWLAQLNRLTETLRIVAGVVVGLLLAATAAIAAFGTRAGFAGHRDSIDIMHLMGAEDSTIAGEFRYRFMLQGLKGGIGGLVLGIATLLVTDRMAGELGEGLIPTLDLAALEWVALALLPGFAAALTMLAAQMTVKRELARLP